MNAVIQLRTSQSELPTVRIGREKNEAYRTREYLTEAESERLLEAAGKSRNPVRDRLLILLVHMLRHSPGYALAGRGVDTRTLQAFMNHRSIANTVIYTAVADKRVRNIWAK
jgi:site-specific recombinase XerD